MVAALVLNAGTTSMGQNAAYSLNGGPTRYSTSNSISDAIDGVTITATNTTTEAVTISINEANNGASSAVDGFVAQFNKTLDTLGQLTEYNEGGNNGIPFGDGPIRRIESEVR